MEIMYSNREEVCLEIKGISFTSQEGIFNVWDLCEELIKDNILGDFAEAGVTAGANPIVMSHVCRNHDQHQRKVHLFDSFCGHPFCLDYELEDCKDSYGLREDQTILEGKLGKTPDVQNVKNYVAQFKGWEEIIEYHPGFFQDTFLNLPDFKLALLRVDVNLIESHELCMKYLYPKLVSGGYFISDDYLNPVIKESIHALMKKEGVDISTTGTVGPEKNIFYFKKP